MAITVPSTTPVVLEPNYIHPWLRKGSVHLLCGASGSGKTRLVSQFMEALQAQEKEWLGLPLAPEPFVYIANDRPMSLIRETWEKMELKDRDKFPYVAALDEDIRLYPAMQIRAKQVAPDATIYIVEHWAGYLGNAKNDAGNVARFMKAMVRWADQNSYTVIGIVEENKAKRRWDKYEDPRQRVSGVAEWGHFADTVMNIDKAIPKCPQDAKRILYVSDHNHQGATIQLDFDDKGRLYEESTT